MRFLRLSKHTVNLELITFIRWDFAGHEGTAQVTFVGGDNVWLQDKEEAEKLRLATVFYDYDHKTSGK